MVYFTLFLYIIAYSYVVKLKTRSIFQFLITFLPIAVLLILVLSLQKEVGTDYYSYLRMASGGQNLGVIKNKGEVLFVLLVNFVRLLNKPQLIFFFSGSLQVFFFMLISFEIYKMDFRLHQFFFLYFNLINIFFAQFNGIRQYIAVYIVIFSFFKLFNNEKNKFIFLVFLASLFHKSSLLFLGFYFLGNKLSKKVPYKIMIIFLLFVIVLINFDLDPLLAKLLVNTNYEHYIDSAFIAGLSIENIITKIPKIIISLLSIYLVQDAQLTEKEIKFINLSYISLVILLISFTSGVIWRIYGYFDFYLIFPTLILFDRKLNKNVTYLIGLLLIIILLIKIFIFPRGEFLYNSIL